MDIFLKLVRPFIVLTAVLWLGCGYGGSGDGALVWGGVRSIDVWSGLGWAPLASAALFIARQFALFIVEHRHKLFCIHSVSLSGAEMYPFLEYTFLYIFFLIMHVSLVSLSFVMLICWNSRAGLRSSSSVSFFNQKTNLICVYFS
jgi:hypothetical protein